MNLFNLEQAQEELKGATTKEIFDWTIKNFAGEVTFASSLGQEDQVITDLITKYNLDVPIFTLDTGRLFPESYELIERTESQYGVKIKTYSPDATELEEMVMEKGINLFYKSIENRKQCCKVRKLNPLKRALAPYKVWICGLRREQSVTRTTMQPVEWDSLHNMIKVNPLIDWTMDEMLTYIKENNVPYNPLHDQGFLSIGCAPCTKAVPAGGHVRDGRWWWEQPEQKECGLHYDANGKTVRTKDLNN